MSHLFKVKLALAALCIMTAGAAQLYLKGIDEGMAASDTEAFDAYTHFAKQMQHETHLVKAKSAKAPQAHAVSVWAAVDRQ